MAKEWIEYTDEEKQEYINNLQNLDDEKLIEYWNNYNGGNNYQLTIYEVEDFDDNFLVADRHREKAIDNAPLNWKDYIYISLTGEVFDSIWEYSEFKQMIEEEGWEDFAQFIVECCDYSDLDDDDSSTDWDDCEVEDEGKDLSEIKQNLMNNFIGVYFNASSVYGKINSQLEKNGVENDNPYNIPTEIVEYMLDAMLDKLEECELHLLNDFILITEAHTVRNYCSPEQTEDYIKFRVDSITYQWNESLKNEEI